MTTTQKTIALKIAENTGLSRYRSRKALKFALECIQRALGDGKEVDLGRLGKLKVVTRVPSRRINKMRATIEDIYRNYPKTVRLLGGKDLSEDPQPTVIHKALKAEIETPTRKKVQIAIAFPSWRRR